MHFFFKFGKMEGQERTGGWREGHEEKRTSILKRIEEKQNQGEREREKEGGREEQDGRSC